MNTPPPESEFPKPEPFPSVSTPVPQLLLADSSSPPTASGRRRRHTIVTRSDAALELLSDGDDNEQEDQTLDRISGILSTLLQEANDAIQNNNSNNITRPFSPRKLKGQPPRPRPHSALSRSSTTHYIASSRPKSILSLSRLPRPTHSTQYRRTHNRNSSISSSASSASLFSPAPTTEESPTTASSVEHSSNYFLDHPKDSNLHHHDDIILTRSLTNSILPSHSLNHSDDEDGTEMMDETRQTHDDHSISPIDAPPPSATTQYILPRFDGPLMESFRRLDSSMAMVESLSRDLAQQQNEMAHQGHPRLDTFLSSTSTTSKLALLFLPLLHIPHALITTVFDTLISSPGNTTWSTSSSSSFVNASSSFSGIVAWTLCFALANIVVTWSGAPSRCLTQRRSSADIVRPRRLSLPGSYQSNNNNNNIWNFEANHGMERSKRPTPINTTLCHRKQSASYSVRRTSIKRSTPSSAKKRAFRPSPSSTNMAITQSNDRSYALAIQQSRAWKKQQLDQKIPDGWEWMGGGHQQQQQLTRRRYSF